MRAGACTVQQTLTSEAASVLKHSFSLARRRGHAQITPLHVAATLLSSRASLLRRACIKSQPHPNSHPLQCRALELCFNVSLNRLPTTPGPFLHGQPSLSNALIAALKRAQAHQRRGSIEQQQQQPLLAVKVELEQLIISILDDPSVSRVMREAGFSSTSVKNNLEDTSVSSVFQCYSSSTCSTSPTETHREIINPTSFCHTHFLNCSSEKNPVLFSNPKKQLNSLVSDSTTEKEDFGLVLEVLLRKKRKNTVVVGDTVSTTEGLITELIGRMERGEVPDELRSAHFIKVQFSSVSLRFMKREDVEMKIADLRRKVGSLASGGGAIIYAGDLKWTVEPSLGERNGDFSGYSPVDHLVAEIGRLLSDYSSSNSNVWLMATANYQTYMRCQLRQPPLEIQWALQAVSVPSSGLGLSLSASSALDSRLTLSQNQSQLLEAKPFTIKEEQDKLTCCAECTSNFEKEAGIFKSGQPKSSLLLSSCNIKDMDKGLAELPYWLQPHRTNTHHTDDLVELKRKWNRLCHSLHHPRPNQIHPSSSLINNQSICGKSHNYASSYPWWSTGLQFNQNNSFPDSNSISFSESTSKPNFNSNFVSQFGSRPSCSIEFGFGTQKPQIAESLDSLKNTENKEVKITLALGNPLFSDRVELLDPKREEMMEPRDLCKLLQENVPWQSEIIPLISDCLLSSKSSKKGNWLLIQGSDSIGKRRLAHAIAESLCGSATHLIDMNMRRRDDKGTQCSKILTEALKSHEKCVFLLEEIDHADTQVIEFLADGFESRNFEDPIGREISISQAIFVMTTNGFISDSNRNEKPNTVIQMKFHFEETSSSSGLSNSDHKRKAESDSSNMNKTPRTADKEDVSSTIEENGSNKREFSRQLSSNMLDLNIRIEEDDEDGEKPDESYPVSGVPTQEIATDLQIQHGFLKSFENRFVFHQNPAQLSQISESFLSKLKGSFEGVCGSEGRFNFSVEEAVLEEIISGSSFFLNSLFEKWLKDVFQTSLATVKKGGKQGRVRLRLGGKTECVLEEGFMGSNLPKIIQLP